MLGDGDAMIWPTGTWQNYSRTATKSIRVVFLDMYTQIDETIALKGFSASEFSGRLRFSKQKQNSSVVKVPVRAGKSLGE
jgi:hypothetical protein